MNALADNNGKVSADNFDKIMANASAQAKVYVQQTDAAALSTTAFAESQQRLAKISNTVIGGLKGIGASLLSMGVTLAVSAALNAVVKAVYNAATAEKRYREAALDSATAVNERIQDTQSYIDQIKELREALDDGNLTENEAYETRKKLIGVQDELSGKYGDELKGIDLVNGGLEKQIGLLDEAAKKKANAFLTETDKDSENNKRAIETAQRNMSRFDTYGSSVNNLTASDLQILKKYAAANGFKQNTYKNSNGEKFSIDIAFQGDASGAEKAYNDFLTDVQNDKTLSQNIKDSITEQGKMWLQNIQEITSANEELAQQAAKYQIQTTTAYNELYENLAQAQKDYNEAVAKDDDIAIKKAVEDGKNAIGAIRSAAFNQSENDYHTDLSDANNAYIKQYMQAQADELESSTKLKAAQIGIQEVLKTSNTAYKESQQAIAKLTESEKQYGNVSNTNRDIIKWNAENMYKYRAAIKTHGWDVSAGDWSTAEGEYNEFGKGDNQIEIAYTPMLQTDSGLVPLTNREMTQYLDDIINAATDKNGKIDLDKLFELDAKGLDMRVNSQMQHVNSMLAAAEGQIVDGVKLTGADVAAIAGSSAEELVERFGHTSDYLGKSMHDIQDQTLKYKTVAKDAFDDIDYSTLTDYLDITKEDAKDIVDTIKSSVQSLNGLNDLDLADIGSLENAGTEITAYTKEQVQAYDNMKLAADKLGISMSDLIDILVKAGLVTGESIKYTNEFTTNALSAATNATKAISLVTAAMQSQSTTAGVSSDSYSELIKEQGEYAAALDFENGYVKLNTDMAKKITQAKIDEAEANIKLAYSQNQMKYSQVKADLETLNTAVRQNGELEGENAEQVEKARSELEAQSKQLRENCRNLQMQYSLLVQNSGAYQDWVNAQNATESGDMYDSIIKAKQTIAEGLKNGKIGTEKFKAAVELTIPEDYQGDIAKYMKRLNRYFKQASDGSANVSKALDGLKREVPITLNFGVKGTIISAVSNGLSVFGKRNGSKSSDTHNSAAGTPNASGGKTLVGEIGNELVVNPHTGKWYTVGDNGAEFVNLPHGAIVFDHEKTQRLLKNGFVGGYGDALVSGNAMDAGSPGVGSFVGTAGNNYLPGKNPLVKSTYKATTASTKATKDNSKALEENKKALEKQKTALEKQKTALEKESNKLKIYGQAAIDEIEKREKALNKEKEAQDKAFDAEIDHLNEIKDAKDKELDAETKRIKEEKDAKDKAWEKEKKQLEEKKEALQDANDEEDRAIKLAELKDALAKAQANRTVRIYNRNQGFIWAADQEAVNNAQTALDDQMRDWKREDVIKAVEDEIDAIDKLKDAYDEETDNRLDDIDKEKEAFDEKIEAEIEDINKRKDAYDKAIEAEIEKLDEVKEKWNEAMSLIGTSWEDYQLQLAAAAHFTDMSLDGMSGEISGYKDDVLANMKEIGGVTDQIDAITESIEKLEEAISNAKDAASGVGGGSNTTDYSSLFPQGDGSDVGSGDDDSSSDGIVSKLENQRDAVENLRAAVESASDQNKEYTKTEQELSKTLEDGNLVGAQRAGIMQEYTAAQSNTRQSFDLLIQKSKEYTQAIIDEKDISQGARDAEVASLAYLLERHVGTSDTITQILSDYATALTENTSITGEQYQNSIDMLLGVSDQAQLSGDQMQTVLEATTYAVASSTQMDNEQRQTQMDSLIALAQQHGISTEEIIGYLANADIKMEESGVKTKDAHEKISAAVKDACKSLCLDYNTVIQKVDEAIAAYKREQEEISKLVQARKQASVIANGFSVNGGGGSLATQRVARYATGVLNAATTHIAITDEKGPEIKMRKPSFGQYSLIEKGSSVIPSQPSANLWKFGLDPESFIASHMNQRSIKSVEITQPNMSSAPVVNVGDIQMYGVNDPDSFARVLHDRVGGIFAQEFSRR